MKSLRFMILLRPKVWLYFLMIIYFATANAGFLSGMPDYDTTYRAGSRPGAPLDHIRSSRAYIHGPEVHTNKERCVEGYKREGKDYNEYVPLDFLLEISRPGRKLPSVNYTPETKELSVALPPYINACVDLSLEVIEYYQDNSFGIRVKNEYNYLKNAKFHNYICDRCDDLLSTEMCDHFIYVDEYEFRSCKIHKIYDNLSLWQRYSSCMAVEGYFDYDRRELIQDGRILKKLSKKKNYAPPLQSRTFRNLDNTKNVDIHFLSPGFAEGKFGIKANNKIRGPEHDPYKGFCFVGENLGENGKVLRKNKSVSIQFNELKDEMKKRPCDTIACMEKKLKELDKLLNSLGNFHELVGDTERILYRAIEDEKKKLLTKLENKRDKEKKKKEKKKFRGLREAGRRFNSALELVSQIQSKRIARLKFERRKSPSDLLTIKRIDRGIAILQRRLKNMISPEFVKEYMDKIEEIKNKIVQPKIEKLKELYEKQKSEELTKKEKKKIKRQIRELAREIGEFGNQRIYYSKQIPRVLKELGYINEAGELQEFRLSCIFNSKVGRGKYSRGGSLSPSEAKEEVRKAMAQYEVGLKNADDAYRERIGEGDRVEYYQRKAQTIASLKVQMQRRYLQEIQRACSKNFGFFRSPQTCSRLIREYPQKLSILNRFDYRSWQQKQMANYFSGFRGEFEASMALTGGGGSLYGGLAGLMDNDFMFQSQYYGPYGPQMSNNFSFAYRYPQFSQQYMMGPRYQVPSQYSNPYGLQLTRNPWYMNNSNLFHFGNPRVMPFPYPTRRPMPSYHGNFANRFIMS